VASNVTTNAASHRAVRRLASTLSGKHLYRSRLYTLLATYTQARNKTQLTTVYEQQAQKKLQQRDELGARLFGYLTELTRQSNLSPLRALSMILPKDEVAIIEAHPSDQLDKGFKRAAFLATKKYEIRAAFTSSLIMPFMALAVGLMTSYYLLSNQVPIYQSALPLDYWPSIAKPMLTLYAIFVTYLPVTVGAIIALIAWIKLYSLPAPPGGHRRFVDPLPPWSVQKRLQASVFLTSLGVLLQQKNTLRAALESLASVSPLYLATFQKRMLRQIEANLPASQIIGSEIFEVETRNYLSDFVDQEGLPELMQQLGEERLNHMAKDIENLSTLTGSLIIMISMLFSMYVTFTGFELNQAMLAYYK